jgi:hypothetical protein
MASHENPTEDKLVRTVLAGIRRVKGTAQVGKDPISPTCSAHVGTCVGRSPCDARPGSAPCRFRRGVASIGTSPPARRISPFQRRNLAVTIPQSKTDQAGKGRWLESPNGSHLESCPVRALGAWIEQSGITGDICFRRWEGGAGKPWTLPSPTTN